MWHLTSPSAATALLIQFRSSDYLDLCVSDIKHQKCLWICMSVSACIHPAMPFRQRAAVAFSAAVQPQYLQCTMIPQALHVYMLHLLYIKCNVILLC